MIGRMSRLATLIAVLPFAMAQAPAPTRDAAPTRPPSSDSVTHHTLVLPGRTLHFVATAGTVRLQSDKGAPRADIAYIAFQLEGADPATRKLTFVLNGGPGFASGWLNVGAVGPWRIPFAGGPSAPSALLPNPDTWLDFTDLVFIDAADTGFSRILGNEDEGRKTLFSVDGDINSLAEAMRLWLDHAERNVSPKYLLGESYGGFRGPRLARALAHDRGTGLSGLILVSPVLDFGGRSRVFDPLYYAMRLPTMAAVVRRAGSRTDLADVEHYAATDFVVDAIAGERDPAAIGRRAARVAAFTGLPAPLVARYGGLVDNDIFTRELHRPDGRVSSVYDGTVTMPDPWPEAAVSRYPDPILEGLQAPVASAMAAMYSTKLIWRPDGAYQLQSPTAFRQWDWGHGMGPAAQSAGWMRDALALDPHLHVLIAHGLYDLVTPYFGTQLQLDQIPASVGADRVRLVVYPGGHMFYSQDASRAAFRADARQLFDAW
jgi:carboxypeptidase C (cathepsin A)